MKYIINANIEFDTLRYILKSLNRPQSSVKLSNPAGQILEELIKYRNCESPVTREHLFTVVWKDYGFEPSNGNLNQQISLIRKTLVQFGLKPSSIITIPKRGFKLNNQLTIKNIQENMPDINTVTSNQIKRKKDIFFEFEPIFLSFKTYTKYTIILIVTIITVFSVSSIYLYNKTNNVRLYCCKEINSCNICTFSDNPNVECKDHSIIINSEII